MKSEKRTYSDGIEYRTLGIIPEDVESFAAYVRQMDDGEYAGFREGILEASEAARERVIDGPAKAARYITAEIGPHDSDLSVYGVVYLGGRGERPLSVEVLHTGGRGSVATDRAVLLRKAIESGAREIMTFERHASGCPRMSQRSQIHAANVQEGCDIVGIRLRDHLVLGEYEGSPQGTSHQSGKSFMF